MSAAAVLDDELDIPFSPRAKEPIAIKHDFGTEDMDAEIWSIM